LVGISGQDGHQFRSGYDSLVTSIALALVKQTIRLFHDRFRSPVHHLRDNGQEINPSSTQPFRWVVVRSTSEPIVVNLPDKLWDPGAE
jgi:hypothetical protein